MNLRILKSHTLPHPDVAEIPFQLVRDLEHGVIPGGVDLIKHRHQRRQEPVFEVGFVVRYDLYIPDRLTEVIDVSGGGCRDVIAGD